MHPLRKQPQPPFPDPWWGYELEGRGGVEDPAGLGVSVRPQDGRDLVLLLGGCPPPRTPPDHLSVRQASAVAAANWYRGPPSPVKSFFGVTFHAPSCRHFGMGNTRSERVRLRGDQQSPRNFRSSKLSSPWERVLGGSHRQLVGVACVFQPYLVNGITVLNGGHDSIQKAVNLDLFRSAPSRCCGWAHRASETWAARRGPAKQT
jgi:hypothetical protein